MTHDESGLDEFAADTTHNPGTERIPEPAPVLWLDVVETKPKTLEEFSFVSKLGYGVTNPDTLAANYREYLDRFQPFRLVLKSAGNNEILMHGESYFHKDDALHTARLIGSAGTTVFLRQAEHGNETLRLGVVDNGGAESDTSGE